MTSPGTQPATSLAIDAAVQHTVVTFEALTREGLAALTQLYAATAWFKDPFNEVRGADTITRIFAHMFEQVDAPRFVVRRTVAQGHEAFLIWDFHFALRRPLPTQPRCIHGCSHLRFNEQGQITEHRDYWDTAEELYSQLPILGPLMRALRRRSATPI